MIALSLLHFTDTDFFFFNEFQKARPPTSKMIMTCFFCDSGFTATVWNPQYLRGMIVQFPSVRILLHLITCLPVSTWCQNSLQSYLYVFIWKMP